MIHVLKLLRRRVDGTPFAASPRLLALPLLALLVGAVLLALR